MLEGVDSIHHMTVLWNILLNETYKMTFLDQTLVDNCFFSDYFLGVGVNSQVLWSVKDYLRVK